MVFPEFLACGSSGVTPSEPVTNLDPLTKLLEQETGSYDETTDGKEGIMYIPAALKAYSQPPN